jgi:Xaa-Pro aminopeptidase
LERLEWDWAPTEAQQFAKEAAERYPGLGMRNIYDKIRKMRVKKAAVEAENIKEAIEITGKGIENIMRHAQAGLGENELQAHFDFTLTCSGVKDHAFTPIVASGKNGAVLHYHDNNCTVPDGSLVLLDLGAQYGYYSADISRTFPINGRFTERQAILYNIVLKAQLETMKAIKPGVPYTKLKEVTKKVLINECKQIGLIKEDSEISKYYYHGVAHHLGLDTHDVGDREGALEAGMVLTVEPGLYIEEEGIGIRIEDDVLITENGCENLSQHIIKTVEEIEAFMAKR